VDSKQCGTPALLFYKRNNVSVIVIAHSSKLVRMIQSCHTNCQFNSPKCTSAQNSLVEMEAVIVVRLRALRLLIYILTWDTQYIQCTLPTLFRGCSCDPSDSKSQSHRSCWCPSRTVQSRRRDNTGQNAQNMCGDLGNWWVARGMYVLHIHPTSQERWP